MVECEDIDLTQYSDIEAFSIWQTCYNIATSISHLKHTQDLMQNTMIFSVSFMIIGVCMIIALIFGKLE